MNTKEFADSQCNPSIDVSMFSYVIFFYTRLFIFVDTRWYEYVEGQGVQLARI